MDIGLIILIAAIVVFVAMAVFVLATGFKNQWPEGAKFVVHKSVQGKGHEVTVIANAAAIREVESGMTPIARIGAAAYRAVVATDQAWQKVIGKPPSKNLDEVGVWLLSNAEFDALTPTASANNAMQLYVKRRIGHGPILVVMRAKLMGHAFNTGEPIIHELLHAMGGDYHHTDTKVWDETGDKEDGVQSEAQRLYKVAASKVGLG